MEYSNQDIKDLIRAAHIKRSHSVDVFFIRYAKLKARGLLVFKFMPTTKHNGTVRQTIEFHATLKGLWKLFKYRNQK